MKKREKNNISISTSRRNFIRNTSLLAGGLIAGPSLNGNSSKVNIEDKLKVKQEDTNLIIDSSSFALCLSTKDGLKAVWWHNKICDRRLDMGNGNETGFTLGLPEGNIKRPKLKVNKLPKVGFSALNEVVFELYVEEVNAKVTVIYSWNGIEPVLKKEVRFKNEGETPWNRLLDVYLGTYFTDAKPTKDSDWPVLVPRRPRSTEMVYWEDPAGRERGYPAYLENQFFTGIAHPSGFSLLTGNKLELHHHPGKVIDPGSEYISYQAVFGISKPGEARNEFKKHLYSRMRRVLRCQDHPYAIIDTCGAQKYGEKNAKKEIKAFEAVTEKWCLSHIKKLEQAQKDTRLHFDNYVIEFWHDIKGDLKQCDPERFPNNFDNISPSLNQIGTDLGLWISSGYEPHGATDMMDPWTIGSNPKLKHCSTSGDGKGRLCRSTPPANKMYIEGFIHHIRKNHIRQIKIDSGGGQDSVTTTTYNRMPLCNNKKHDHLPGIFYSVEANHNAQIEFLNAIDRECSEVFLTLYWGHHSPWWLLHGNTVYDIGLRMEMASLATPPALFVRSSNVRRLDQGKYIAAKDYPEIAWDSLGVALSDWKWNGRQGTEKWQEGVLMDICRGSMLLHIWSDNDAIPVSDRPQMTEFIDLLKGAPDCFKNPHSVGNPFKDDWWGYCCTNGKKAFIAIDNGSWEDQLVNLELNSSWGLADNVEWDIYCWYPNHIEFKTEDNSPFGANAKVAIRPFTAVLFEVVPHGHKPTLKKDNWEKMLLPTRFKQESRNIEIIPEISETENGLNFSVKGVLPQVKDKSWLAITIEFYKDGEPHYSNDNEPISMIGNIKGENVEFKPALMNGHFPAPWQTFRLETNEEFSEKEFQLECSLNFESNNVELVAKSYFIPIDT